jgi:outer membrane protein OmpA-like peptidoglycan-associated protein
MSNHNSSYNFWTWLVAILLALILLWALLTGRGTGTCCSAPVTAAPIEEAMPAAPAVVAEACAFSATASEFIANDACANLAWVSKSDELKSYLVGDLRAEGNDKSVVLTGTVDTEDIKTQKGQEAQTFFGPDVAVDNQITVKAAEPVAMMPPPAAKLYFDTGKTALKSEADASLAPIIEWLNAHPESKAVVSGFHDPRGNQARNEDLAYNRAKAVQAALITAGIDVLRIELVKPEATDGGGDLAEARRVEVSVK